MTLTAEDIREGVVGVLSIYVHEPQFQGQTKDRLNNPEVAAPGRRRRAPGAREVALREPHARASAIVARIILAARAREASRAAAQAGARARRAVCHRLNLPGKLADCSSTDPDESELFIVEGDSRRRLGQAGARSQAPRRSSRCAARCSTPSRRRLQKVLGEQGAAGHRVARSAAASATTSTIEQLRYGKIFLLMDADSDGHHIATLLLTFFYRHLRPLIEHGPRLPRAAAALPHRRRQGDVLGARRGRARPHPRRRCPRTPSPRSRASRASAR